MSFLFNLFNFFSSSKKQVKIVCCGLDNSGKTTIINLLKPKKLQSVDVTPTVGFCVEKFQKNNLNFTVFDMSGQGRFRNLWESFYPEANGMIFVVDSSDRLRMAVARNELEALVDHKAVKNIPILILANKQDLPNAVLPDECCEILNLHSLKDRSWTIVATDALKGVGIEEGVKWLSLEINKII